MNWQPPVLKNATQMLHPTVTISPPKLKTEDMVLFKDHTAASFGTLYVIVYRVVSIKRNQVENYLSSSGKTKNVHISNVKYVLPADNGVYKLSDCTKFGCKSKIC